MNEMNGQTMVAQKKGVSGSTLKLIAIITMLIDHIGAVVLGRMLWQAGYMEAAYSQEARVLASWMAEHGGLYLTYWAMRMIGRVAFPIFIFLMVEGFEKTGNRWKYLGRMAIFAIISEIPFNLALSGNLWDRGYQSVYFTLAIGLFAMILCDLLEKHLRRHEKRVFRMGCWLLGVLVVIAAAALAEWLCTDYGAIGILCIMVIFLSRRKKLTQTIAGALAFLWEGTAPLAFIPIWFYNGKRGLKLKYVFYIFYPAHLLILYLISYFMGLGAFPAL